MDISSILGYLVLVAFILGFIYLVYWSFTDEKAPKKVQKNNKTTVTISKSDIPTWFTGEVYQSGKYCENPSTKKGIYLNNLEASMYDVANGSIFHILALQKTKLFGDNLVQNYRQIDPNTTRDILQKVFQNDLDLTSKWLEENNSEAYQILIKELDFSIYDELFQNMD